MCMSHDPTVTFDLVNPEVAKNPGPYFQSLRSECPVARTDAFGGFWMLSRYDDIHDAARQTTVFSNASGVTIPPAPNPPSVCLEQDEPQHSLYRAPMQSWFAPGKINKLEASVREIVSDLIDRFESEDSADLATALAEPVPPIVIAMLLGLPESEWPWFRERNEGFLRAGAEGDPDAAMALVMELVVYLSEKLADRRANPGDDMLTDIVRVEVDGRPLTDDEAVSLAFLLLAAGHETTVGAIGGMLYHVARDRTTRDRLLDDPSLVPLAVEEALRLEPSLMGLGRMSLEDVTVRGVTIPKGERVMLLFGAANRDEAVFEDAEEFHVDRPNNRHLTFGSGIHRCVGAPLARLEMRIVLEEVLRRMPGLRLVDEEAVQVSYAFSRAYRALPVTW